MSSAIDRPQKGERLAGTGAQGAARRLTGEAALLQKCAEQRGAETSPQMGTPFRPVEAADGEGPSRPPCRLQVDPGALEGDRATRAEQVAASLGRLEPAPLQEAVEQPDAGHPAQVVVAGASLSQPGVLVHRRGRLFRQAREGLVL